MPGARCTRSLVCKGWWHTSVATTSTPGLPGIPARNGFTAYFALSPEIGLSCLRRLRRLLRKLDASVEASGPHDFAVREKAPSSKRYPRPPHPAPTSVTIAIRPSSGTGCEYM
jgi:hypothetical protein